MTAQPEMTPSPTFSKRCARTQCLKERDRKLLRRYIKRLVRLVKRRKDVSELDYPLYLDSLFHLSAPENRDMAAEIGYGALLCAVEELLCEKISEHDKETHLLGIGNRQLEKTLFNSSLQAWELRYCDGLRVFVSADTRSIWIYTDETIRAERAMRLNDAMTFFC